MEELRFVKGGEDSAETTSQKNQSSLNWTESEWFKDWLRLARRDYQGRIIEDPKPLKG